jgi:hypothetical protein
MGSTIAPSETLTVERIALGSTTAYLMVRGTEVGLVDTGGGGRVTDIEEALSTIGLGWDSVGTVILTYRHGDHVGSLAAVVRELDGALIGAGEGDLSGISGASGIVALADGETVFGSTIIATPGHTPATSLYGTGRPVYSSQEMPSTAVEAGCRMLTEWGDRMRHSRPRCRLPLSPPENSPHSNPTPSSSATVPPNKATPRQHCKS